MKAPSDFSRGNNRGKWVMELSKMIAIEAKLDAIMHRMDKQERKMHTCNDPYQIIRVFNTLDPVD